MTIETRKCEAIVEISVCDACGDEDYTEAVIDGRRFDPGSRSSGHPSPTLWDGHPWRNKDVCRGCMKKGAHVVAGHPAVPTSMIRAKLYESDECEKCSGKGCNQGGKMVDYACQEGRRYSPMWGGKEGLRLPEKPMSDADWEDVSHCGLVLSEDGERALVLSSDDRHWMAATVCESETRRALGDGDELIVLMDHTKRTPFRTVFAMKLVAALSQKETRERYGDEIGVRFWDEYVEAFEVSLRVPMEILQ